MTSDSYDLIIYIPTYNRLEKLENCLKAISREIIGFEDKVLVYVSNNGSTDGTRDYLHSLDYKWLYVRHNEANEGYPLNILHCFNLPIRAKFVWSIGDDDYLMPKAISGLLRLIKEYPTADYIFCNTTAFPTKDSADILRKYFETGSIEGGLPKSRKYKGTSLVDFEQLIDPTIADTLLGELMVNCFRQSKLQSYTYNEAEFLDYLDSVDRSALDFETTGKLCQPQNLPFLSCFQRETKAVYCDTPRTFNFWGSAEWLGDYDYTFPVIILFLISQYKEHEIISEERFYYLLDYYYASMQGSLVRQVSGQSTARPFNSMIKAKMFDYLFLYMNKRLKKSEKKRDDASVPVKSDKRIETVNVHPVTTLTSIIILTLNQIDHTRLCLQSIVQHTPEPHEIIIVDNGSTDGTLGYLREFAQGRQNVRVISNSENLGFAAGNNQGMAVANGGYVLLLNNDTVVTEGWLPRMVSAFERFPDTGIVGPVSNNVSGPQQIKEATYQSLEEMHRFAGQWSAAHAGHTAKFFRIVGFCLLAKREVIEKIGGLDETFGSGNFEDDDFCIRAALAGYKARIALDAFIHHTGSQTFKGAGINYRKSMERNWGIFKTKWKMPHDLPLGSPYSLTLDAKDLPHFYFPLPDRAEVSSLIITTQSGGNDGQPPTEVYDSASERKCESKLKGLLEMGEEMFSQGDFVAAVRLFEEALQLDSKNSQALNNLGAVQWQIGDMTAAMETFQLALSFNPKDPDALANLLQAARETRRIDLIKPALLDILKQEYPDNPDIEKLSMAQQANT